ncbi:MAG: glycoside hydrolase family 78 protein, partial [Lachnospiraceae bacterium]|nr:glycoside hydrolase family 78 protein [Lachnospiraceae bacterium]
AILPAVDLESGKPVITEENCRKPHRLTVEVRGNTAYTWVDGVKIDETENNFFGHKEKAPRTINPLGPADVTTYPRLCEIGYYAGKDTRVRFDGLRVRNLRPPCAEIAAIDTESGKNLAGEAIETCNPSRHSIPMLRCDFEVPEKVRSARLYATARGIYECRINGKPVSDICFAPGAGQYDRHLLYQTYDVTELLREGANAIGCVLTSGWWSDASTYALANYNYWGDRMSFLAKLVIHYEDGSRRTVVTDSGAWKYYGEGPWRYAGFFNGEQYDARRADIWENFSLPGFAMDGLQPPAVIRPVPIGANPAVPAIAPPWPAVNETEPLIIGNYQAPVREAQTLQAKSMTEPAKGIYIYDLGQEIAGVPRIRFREREGQRVVLRYGEMLYPDREDSGYLAGRLLQANLREASNTDIYICRGQEGEVFQPHFTFHGFRYIEISGVSRPPELSDVCGVLLTSVPEITGDFSCDNELVNQLVSNVAYSQQSNFISIPTDCPQRNERMGWVGDAHVFARTACLQADVKNFYLRYLDMMRDLQREDGRLPNIAPVGGGFGGITYESAMILIVWELWQRYGDLTVVADYYDAMDRWMAAIRALGMPGVIREFGLGDWLAMEETDNDLIWNAFYYRDAKMMEDFAQLLEKKEDAERYAGIASDAKTYWNRHFVDPVTGCSRTLEGVVNDTQGSYAIALSCGVYEEKCREPAYAHLDRKVRESGYTVRTGFFGTGVLCSMLTEGGYAETARRLLTSRDYPGWLYPITQGATTVWERWNSYTREDGFGGNNAMNSFNHYSLGSVVAWLYEYVLGIRPDPESPGMEHFIIQPLTGAFAFAGGGVELPSGRAESRWNADGDEIIYRCRIPENTTATLILNGNTEELGSGNHTFRIARDTAFAGAR